MACTIEASTHTDIPKLISLINSAYRGESSRRGWTTEADLLDGIRTDEMMLGEILRDANSLLLKCVADDQIIGCVHLRKEVDRLYLGMLTVSPELQGGGVGKRLLQAAEEQAQSLQCSSIYMTVISLRTELIAWYVRHGYRDTGARKPFPFGDPRFGIPKRILEFTVLEKAVISSPQL